MDSDRREHLTRDLHAAFEHGGDWFTCHVFRLIAKADRQNRARLAVIFPDEVEVYQEWHDSPGEICAG